MDSNIFLEHPGAIVIGLILCQVFLFAARAPIHRALEGVGRAVGNGLRLAARICRGWAQKTHQKTQELVLENGRAAMEGELDKEFERLSTGFAAELQQYPQLHHQLCDQVAAIETDIQHSAAPEPQVPGWPKAVAALMEMPDQGDIDRRRVLKEFQKMANHAEQKATKEYRQAVGQRHRVLARLHPALKVVQQLLSRTHQRVDRALSTTHRIDAQMETYQRIRGGDPRTARMLVFEQVTRFVVCSLLVGMVVVAAFVNFHLIALPMSELIPTTARVGGVSVSVVAALVIVLMEAAAGCFVMDALGITHLLPPVGLLPASRRRLLLGFALVALVMLAAIESSLAILREQILQANLNLQQSLTHTAGPSAPVMATSSLPLIGQAALGFILPFVLAMLAIPLEGLIDSSRHVIAVAAGSVVSAVGTVLRLLGHGFRQLMRVAIELFDVLIIIPIQIEQLIRRRPHTVPAAPPHPKREQEMAP